MTLKIGEFIPHNYLLSNLCIHYFDRESGVPYYLGDTSEEFSAKVFLENMYV